MSKRLIFLIIIVPIIYSCSTTPQSRPPIDINLTVRSADKTPIKVEGSEEPTVSYGMEIPNQEGSLSRMSFFLGDQAFIKIFSSLTIGDVSNLWNDIVVLKESTDIRKLVVFINSAGGDAFSGLALADELERAKREGFHITAHASGIVASAAVPVFVVADRRLAAPGTIFMVHETSIWKWPGRETASDIRSQNRLMSLIRDRYLGKLAFYSKLSIEEWGDMEQKTTWFSAGQAKEWGIVDEIE